MKILTLLFALLGLAKYCSKPKEYRMPANNIHKEILITALQSDLLSGDSLQKAIAEKFIQSITKEYNTYKPDREVMAELKKSWNDSLSVKVIGGNWCSDTRRELPRICGVLDGINADASGFGYYKVSKDKKPLQQDFASEHPVTRVPTVFIFKNGNLLGQIVETPGKTWESDLLDLIR